MRAALSAASLAGLAVAGLAVAGMALLLPAPAGAQALPRADIQYAQKPVRIDGKLDDPAWRTAIALPLGTVEGQAIEGGPVARMAWDNTYLYLAVEIPDEILIAGRSGRDVPVWEKDDVLEVFLWPQESQPYYYQFAVNPRGALYDAFFIANATHTGAVLALPDWNADVKVQTRLAPATVYRPDRPGPPAPGGSWTVEMAIPVAAMTSRPAGSPAPGETWRAQIVRFNRPDSKPGALDGASWSPYGTVTEPYLLDRFGTIVFQGGPTPVVPALVPGTGVSTQPIVSPQPAVTPDTTVVTPPTAPTTPTTPAEPTTPVEPVTPAEPATPAEPTTPATPTEPTTPTEPAAPVTPTEPAAPTTPAPTVSDNRTVTLNLNGVPLADAIDLLFRGTTKKYVVTAAAAQAAPSVKIEVKDLPFDAALAAILKTASAQNDAEVFSKTGSDGTYTIDSAKPATATAGPSTPPSTPPSGR